MPKDKEKLSTKSKNRRGGEVVERGERDPWTEMDRLFSQFRSNFNDLFYRNMPTFSETKNENVMPPLADVVDHGDRFELNVELPGVSKDDVDVEVTPYTVKLSAEKGEKGEKKGRNWLRKERSNFSYYRSFDLPDEIKSDDVEAEIQDGVLTLTMPKENPASSYESKKVKIK